MGDSFGCTHRRFDVVVDGWADRRFVSDVTYTCRHVRARSVCQFASTCKQLEKRIFRRVTVARFSPRREEIFSKTLHGFQCYVLLRCKVLGDRKFLFYCGKPYIQRYYYRSHVVVLRTCEIEPTMKMTTNLPSIASRECRSSS